MINTLFLHPSLHSLSLLSVNNRQKEGFFSTSQTQWSKTQNEERRSISRRVSLFLLLFTSFFLPLLFNSHEELKKPVDRDKRSSESLSSRLSSHWPLVNIDQLFNTIFEIVWKVFVWNLNLLLLPLLEIEKQEESENVKSQESCEEQKYIFKCHHLISCITI